MKKSTLALAALMALAPAVASAKQQDPIRVGGNVQAPERIRYVPPAYPAVAESAQVSGIVIVEAVIGSNGDVTDAKVLKSIPLLDQAALDAVRQWRYSQTTLNGVPVPVIMTVTVNFTIGKESTPPAPASMQTPIGMPPGMGPVVPAEWKGAPPVRLGGTITPPERVKYVAPVYPIDAQRAKVSGVIILQAIIDENGNVALTKVLKGNPMLDDAAVAAVNQWKYVPTTVNGVAVPVLMTVTVNFSLQVR